MLGLFTERRLPIDFEEPDEGGDGLDDMINGERAEGAIDLFAPETGVELERYLDNALAMGGVAVGDSQSQES